MSGKKGMKMPPRSKEHLANLSSAMKGRKIGPPMNDEIRAKISESAKKIQHTPDWNKRVGDAQRGEKGNNWQGGKTPLAKLIRSQAEYKNWRKQVYERDNYTCQICRERGGKLNADHIKSFAYYIELRYEITNGRTLCEPCHRQTPNFGGKARRE